MRPEVFYGLSYSLNLEAGVDCVYNAHGALSEDLEAVWVGTSRCGILSVCQLGAEWVGTPRGGPLSRRRHVAPKGAAGPHRTELDQVLEAHRKARL